MALSLSELRAVASILNRAGMSDAEKILMQEIFDREILAIEVSNATSSNVPGSTGSDSIDPDTPVRSNKLPKTSNGVSPEVQQRPG